MKECWFCEYFYYDEVISEDECDITCIARCLLCDADIDVSYDVIPPVWCPL